MKMMDEQQNSQFKFVVLAGIFFLTIIGYVQIIYSFSFQDFTSGLTIILFTLFMFNALIFGEILDLKKQLAKEKEEETKNESKN